MQMLLERARRFITMHHVANKYMCEIVHFPLVSSPQYYSIPESLSSGTTLRLRFNYGRYGRCSGDDGVLGDIVR